RSVSGIDVGVDTTNKRIRYSQSVRQLAASVWNNVESADSKILPSQVHGQLLPRLQHHSGALMARPSTRHRAERSGQYCIPVAQPAGWFAAKQPRESIHRVIGP